MYIDCMKRFWECLRKHSMKIINFKKKKMKLLAEQQQQSCYIYKENFENKYVKDKKIL